MQSGATGQAPIVLERKITSGGKQIKQKTILVHTVTETNRTPQTKVKVRSAYVLSRYITYARRVAVETETEETA